MPAYGTRKKAVAGALPLPGYVTILGGNRYVVSLTSRSVEPLSVWDGGPGEANIFFSTTEEVFGSSVDGEPVPDRLHFAGIAEYTKPG